MPSVVHGPGKQEGMAAELPPRPSSLWECLADKVEGMDVHQVRRVMMLILRVTIGVRLEDIGRAFDLHKGHVSREIDRATSDLLAMCVEAGIDPPLPQSDVGDVCNAVPQTIRLFREEWNAMRREATRSGFSVSKQARIWLLAGGMGSAIKALRMTPAAEGEPDAE